MNVLVVLVFNLGINIWGSVLFDLDMVLLIFGNFISSVCDFVIVIMVVFYVNFMIVYV